VGETGKRKEMVRNRQEGKGKLGKGGNGYRGKGKGSERRRPCKWTTLSPSLLLARSNTE